MRIAYIDFSPSNDNPGISHREMNTVYAGMFGVNERLKSHEVMCDSFFTDSKTAVLPAPVLNRRYNGVICAMLNRKYPWPKHALRIPVVSILGDTLTDGNNRIRFDNALAIRLLCDHLSREGHSRIAYIDPFVSYWALERDEAVRSVGGISIYDHERCASILRKPRARTLAHQWGTMPLAERRRSIAKMIDAVFREKPQAVIGVNDSIAASIIEHCRATGKSVPGDIAVAGIDDFGHEFEPYGLSFLTTVRQDFFRAGEMAAQMMIEMISGARPKQEQLIRIEPRLIERLSSRKHLSERRKDETVLRNRMLDLLNEKYADSDILPLLARHAGMHPSYLSAKFKALFATTLKRYVSDMRLSKAAFLLANTRQPVLDILYDVGYRDHGAFNKLFRLKFGCTPTAYRGNGAVRP